MLIKKSITLKKHRTSLSLEVEFWEVGKFLHLLGGRGKFCPFALKVYLILGTFALKVSLLSAALKALKVSLLRNPYPQTMAAYAHSHAL